MGRNLFALIIMDFKTSRECVWSAHVRVCGCLSPTQSHAQFLSSLYVWILKFLGFSKPGLWGDVIS